VRSLTAVVAAALVLLPAAPAWAAGSPPVAVDDAVSFRHDGFTTYAVDALGNDSDPDGDRLTYVSVTPAAKGNAFLVNGGLYYRPYLDNVGTDTFTYTISDGQGNTATATVTATLSLKPARPGAPAIGSSAPGSVTLSWSAAAGASQYRIYRFGLPVATTTALTWTESGLSDDRSYSYTISSLDSGGVEGLQSNTLTRGAQVTSPANLATDVAPDPTAVRLLWDSSADYDPSGFTGPWEVYRDGVLRATTTTTDFTETGLVSGQAHDYQVRAVGPPSTTWYSPPSPLSAVLRTTPGTAWSLARLFRALGGYTGILGPVTVPERVIPGGHQQDHLHGIIVQQDGGDAISVRSDIATAYTAVGGATGDLGFPLDEADCTLRDGGCGQFFEGGSIWYQQFTGTHPVRLDIEDAWAATGWEEGPLGYPAGDEITLPDGVWQPFEDGGVYSSAVTGAFGVSGEIHDLYAAQGGPAGALGYPTTAENCGLRGGGCYQAFQGASVHWSPASGAQATTGSIDDAWARQGWENGPLGYPTSTVTCGLRNGGCYQAFQGGSIHWTSATGAQVTSGSIRDAWARRGWENGPLAYPTNAVTCGLRDGGCYQAFQGGSIHWSSATGAHATNGSIRDAWARQGWENGPLGYPTTDVNCGLRNGGCWQGFHGGVIHWSPATGAQITTGGMLGAWGRVGWENGRLGYPTSGATVSGGVTRQTFQGGSISIDARGRVTYR